jgi:hypothetical protein
LNLLPSNGGKNNQGKYSSPEMKNVENAVEKGSIDTTKNMAHLVLSGETAINE